MNTSHATGGENVEAAKALADAATLHRVLRAVASDGVFAEEERKLLRKTPASELLRSDGGWNVSTPTRA